jgi:hypothetical protein
VIGKKGIKTEKVFLFWGLSIYFAGLSLNISHPSFLILLKLKMPSHLQPTFNII